MNFRSQALKPFGLLVEPLEGQEEIRNLDLAELRALFDREHLVVIRGFMTLGSAGEFASFCESWGELCVWPFGKVLELKEQEEPEDHIFDSSYVPLHWDGMYRQQVPEMQIFQCVSSTGIDCGGRATFIHTPEVLKRALRWKIISAL